MKWYDFHVEPNFSQGKSNLEEFLEKAEDLGYAGIVFIFPWQKNALPIIKAEIERVSKEFKTKPYFGFYVKSVAEFKQAAKLRKYYDVLAVKGGNSRLNRLAVDKKEVDILLHPEKGRKDSGLNHIFARLASKNQTAIEINFHEVLTAPQRHEIISKIMTNVMLSKKYGFLILPCSGAYSPWELRDPYAFISLLHELGFELKQAKNIISKRAGEILAKNRKRQQASWIMPGVEVLK